ncbi:DUF4177 domain-containing protein [Micromonospora sp. NPDC000089]|uniref:DUF4177 domain-containing protein n=1 Tax=unclassified Micromonospora TaxID=2617518 RepID=UPI003682A4F5
MKVYKVVTERDRFFLGKYDAEKMEEVLNVYAQEGWTLINALSAENGWKSFSTQLMLIFERDA